jgi:thiosulfate dehydrogenase
MGILSAIESEYPQLDIKSMTIKSVEMIIQGMLGATPQEIPNNSKEMRAMVSYINWLGKNTKKNMNMENTKLDNNIPLPNRESNPTQGKALYTIMCASCHGTKGLRSKKPNFDLGAGYQFPAIAEKDAYDDGGHMYMIPLLTAFLYTNMPLGSSHEKPILKIEDAYDIAAFVNSGLDRKYNRNRVLFYPMPKFRPEGFAIPENFKVNKNKYEKARFGPFLSNFWW